MSAYWRLNTQGDPLTTLSEFFRALWVNENLDMMLVSPDGHGYLLASVEEVMQVNPFHPMMKVNLACLLVDVVNQHPEKKIGVILRACELRALHELASRGVVNQASLLTICVDCLGTYPVEEVKWREERLSLSHDITEEALRFAPQGGIATYRYRPACQVCVNPSATAGMINIGVLGLPVRKEMLVSAPEGKLTLAAITHGAADDKLIIKREKMLEKIIERQQHTRSVMIENLDSSLPGDVDSLLDHLQECGGCHQCRDVCPICSAIAPHQDRDGRLEKEDVLQWLASCAGCGMCEQACPHALPLTAIFNRIRDQQKRII